MSGMIDFRRVKASFFVSVLRKKPSFAVWFVAIGCLLGRSAFAENVPKIVTSEFDTDIKIIGLSLSDTPLGGVIKRWFLRSFVNKKTGRTSTQLYIALLNAKNSYIYNIASDDTANPLHVTEMGHDAYSESFGVELDENILIKRADTGYRIRVSSMSGEDIVFLISPEQIKPQIGALTDILKALNSNLQWACPHIGVKLVPVGYLVAAQSKLQEGRGMVVGNVEPGSVAERAGLLDGDLVLSWDGVATNSFVTLNNALKQSSKKKNIALIVERQGQKFDTQLAFEAR